ncbi:inositol monophosphatase family protein [Candidatus Magnetaquicoccus inordinatus]|uniref:inositol monophosphatase family protein n=1 Tax=Candidatus Magnetaquicoccus inordinatus TaxID=2496818 RepID=UPI001D0E17F2|nr:inositol monophosphatase family protein [Candidatus Magnetaquicoccus inordinatus]
MTMNYSPPTNVAIRAARQAGSRALELFYRRHELEVHNKEHGEWVSNADTAVEKEILYHLKRGYPQYGIVAEESGRQGMGTERYWIVDPIDGTDNFIHGIPHFALSIALAEGDLLLAGVVFNPVSNEMFVGERGRGAFLNDRRIRTGQNRLLSKALLATGFPAKYKEDHLTAYMDSFRILCAACHGIRRQGSAALDLCFTADGRYDGFWEQGLSSWDVAAGALILQEAGGFVTDFAGEIDFLRSGNVVAANAAIHSRLLEKIQSSALCQPASA